MRQRTPYGMMASGVNRPARGTPLLLPHPPMLGISTRTQILIKVVSATERARSHPCILSGFLGVERENKELWEPSPALVGVSAPLEEDVSSCAHADTRKTTLRGATDTACDEFFKAHGTRSVLLNDGATTT